MVVVVVESDDVIWNDHENDHESENDDVFVIDENDENDDLNEN